MPITKSVSAVTDADRPFLMSVSHPNGTVTLYYEGDTLPVQPVSPVMLVLTPRQFRQVLTRTNLRAAVEAAITVADQDTKDWYEFATEFESTHPVLLGMAQAIGKTKADVDALFALGVTL